MKKTKIKYTKPLLRWAGGKSWLTNFLDQYLPTKFNNYYEPFLGGASIALFLKQKGLLNHNVLLSDMNKNLINFYEIVRDQPTKIILELKKYQNEKEEYYLERNKIYRSSIKKAAQFYYLNRTSFNGIYRENLNGKYNVPYGFKTYSKLFDNEQILDFSKHIKNMRFSVCDFFDISQDIDKGDLVFLDPPYTVAHENNGFVQYNQHIFSWEDQERLAQLLLHISNRNAYFILTNAAHESIFSLFEELGTLHILQRSSTIGGKGANRSQVNEYVFTNIDHDYGSTIKKNTFK